MKKGEGWLLWIACMVALDFSMKISVNVLHELARAHVKRLWVWTRLRKKCVVAYHWEYFLFSEEVDMHLDVMWWWAGARLYWTITQDLVVLNWLMLCFCGCIFGHLD